MNTSLRNIVVNFFKEGDLLGTCTDLKRVVEEMLFIIHKDFFWWTYVQMDKNKNVCFFNLSAKMMKWVVKKQQEELEAERSKKLKNTKKIQKMEEKLLESKAIQAIAGVTMLGKKVSSLRTLQSTRARARTAGTPWNIHWCIEYSNSGLNNLKCIFKYNHPGIPNLKNSL